MGISGRLSDVLPMAPAPVLALAAWLVRLDGDRLAALSVATGPAETRPRGRYAAPPPYHVDYLETLGFRRVDSADDGLPDGQRWTDGRIALSLVWAIGVTGWARVGGEVYVLASNAPLGAQVWAMQRGVPFGDTVDDRRCDLEIVDVGDPFKASQVLTAIVGSAVTAAPGLVLRSVDLAWRVHDLWRGSVMGGSPGRADARPTGRPRDDRGGPADRGAAIAVRERALRCRERGRRPCVFGARTGGVTRGALPSAVAGRGDGDRRSRHRRRFSGDLALARRGAPPGPADRRQRSCSYSSGSSSRSSRPRSKNASVATAKNSAGFVAP